MVYQKRYPKARPLYFVGMHHFFNYFKIYIKELSIPTSRSEFRLGNLKRNNSERSQSCATENEAMAAIFILSILINRSFKCLEAWHTKVFGVCKSIGIVRFHVRPKNEAMAAILILSILINYFYFQLNALTFGMYRFT